MFIRGYQYGQGNQIHYLIYANYQKSPSLYPRDYLLATHKLSPTLFPSFVNFTTQLTHSQELSALGIYVITLFAFYRVIFKIGQALGFDKKTIWLSLFLFIYPFPVAQSSINTVEASLMPRFLGDVFLLISVYLLLKKRFRLSILPAAIGFLFHPLTLIPYPLILGILTLTGYFKPPKILYWLFGISLLSLPWAISYYLSQSSNPFFVDPAWREILVSRMPYIFARTWSWKWQVATALIPLFFIYLKKIHPVAVTAVFTSYLLFLINIISDLLSIHLGLELQLTRNLYLVFIFLILYTAKTLTSRINKKLLTSVVIVLSIASILLTLKNKSDEKSYAYTPPAGYVNSALWAKTNTPTDSLFLVPPEISGFRFFSQRSVVVERKEGGDSLYSRKLALEWAKRQQRLTDYYNLDSKKINKLITEYGINYIITTQIMPYPTIYSSTDWKVYNVKEKDD